MIKTKATQIQWHLHGWPASCMEAKHHLVQKAVVI